MVSTPVSSSVSPDRDSIEIDRKAESWCSRAFFAASPIYPILDAEVLGDGDPGPAIRALGTLGIRVVQLRGKRLPGGAFASWVSAAMRGASGNGVRVVVNDRADVALLAGADGVHLGQEDMSVRMARRLLGRGAVIGLSTHTRKELQLARNEPADYLAVGPVFETSTKADSAPVVSLSGVREARRLHDGPLVAIGGIGRERVGPVLAAGADAAAVIAAVAGSCPGEIADKARALLAEARLRPRNPNKASSAINH